MNKKLAWILSAVFLSIDFIYAVTYLASRKSVLSVSVDDGTWAVYFYNKSYIRQYALDASVRELFRLTMLTGHAPILVVRRVIRAQTGFVSILSPVQAVSGFSGWRKK